MKIMLIFFSQQQESSSIEPRSNSSLPQSSLSSRSLSQLLQKQTLVNKTTKNESSQTFKKNKSAQKIKNSYLQKHQLQFRVMTKVKAMKAGIFKATKRVWLDNGYKLIDTSILENSISKFSACKSCKKTDCFDIKEDCKLKRGLFETLILSC